MSKWPRWLWSLNPAKTPWSWTYKVSLCTFSYRLCPLKAVAFGYNLFAHAHSWRMSFLHCTPFNGSSSQVFMSHIKPAWTLQCLLKQSVTKMMSIQRFASSVRAYGCKYKLLQLEQWDFAVVASSLPFISFLIFLSTRLLCRDFNEHKTGERERSNVLVHGMLERFWFNSGWVQPQACETNAVYAY